MKKIFSETENRKGLTFVELLIVIAVIAVLVTIAIIAISPQERLAASRDNRREADLYTVWSAIESRVYHGGGRWDDEGCEPIPQGKSLVASEHYQTEEIRTYDLYSCLGDYLENFVYDPIDGDPIDEDGKYTTDYYVGTDYKGNIYLKSRGETRKIVIGALEELYEIRIFTEEGGSTNPSSGIHFFPKDDEVPVEAIPGEGWGFSHWVGDYPEGDSQEKEITVKMDEELKTVTAHFIDHNDCSNQESVTWSENDGLGNDCGPSTFGSGSTYHGNTNTVSYDNNYEGSAVYFCDDGNWEFQEGACAEETYDLEINVHGGGSTAPPSGSYTYSYGSEVNIIAEANEGWYFKEWAGDYPSGQSGNESITIEMDADKSVTAVFEEYGTCSNSSSVTWSHNDGTGDDCGPSSFGWGSTAHGDTNSTSYLDDYDGEATYLCNDGTWEFQSGSCEVAEYDLTVSKDKEGTVSPLPGTYSYSYGTEVDIVATPDEGWEFDRWTGNYPSGERYNEEITVTITGNKAVTANFVEDFSSCSNTTEVIWSHNDGTGDDCGPTTFGWGITGHGDNNYASYSNDYEGSATYQCNDGTWEFQSGSCSLQEYSLTISTDGDGSTDPWPGTRSYSLGTEVTVVADPDSGWEFSHWSGDYPSGQSGSASITIEMNADKSVTAHFVKEYADCSNSQSVTWSHNDGTGDDCGPTAFGWGTTSHGSARNAYYSNAYEGSANYQCNDGNWNFQSGSCQLKSHQLTINSGNGGYTNPSEGTYTHTHGDSVSVSANSYSGWEFSHWSGDYPSGQSGSPNITIEMDSDKSVTAYFDDPHGWSCGDVFVDDRDGEAYRTVEIGSQCWFAENLRAGEETSGVNLEHLQSSYDWDLMSDQAPIYSVPEGGASDYGHLYNGIAVDEESLCPSGWSLPLDGCWFQLSDYAAEESCDEEAEFEFQCEPTGAKLKKEAAGLPEFDIEVWNASHTDNNCDTTGEYNCLGLDALPAGSRESTGMFYGSGSNARFWSSSKNEDDRLWVHNLRNNEKGVLRFAHKLDYAHTVRCIYGIPIQAYVGGGSGTIEGDGEYVEEGDSITITANPSEGYQFSHWEGDASGTDPNFTFSNVTNPKEAVAIFFDETSPIFINTSSGRSGNIQDWTVPENGTYTITAYGAQGGGSYGGLGAKIAGEFELGEGDILEILVGQEGQSNDPHGGGGGGTFVVKNGVFNSGSGNDSDIYVIAGGGGANGSRNETYEQDGRVTGSGGSGFQSGSGGTGSPGSNGSGGTGNSSAYGGAGFIGNGDGGAQSFINGGLGDSRTSDGGFGGGGGANTGWDRNAGGGGYSGGAGARGRTWSVAGGGGSYNNGTNQSNESGVREGHGMVIIEPVN